MKSYKRLSKALLKKLGTEGPERGGLILPEGELVELTNVAEKPTHGFIPKIDLDLLEQLKLAVGTWHTHPGSSANLSSEDWETFVQWPQLVHAIVGTDGVRWYEVQNGVVLNA